MDHRFGIAADIGDDHRQPRRHALENNVGETLLARGQKSEIRGGVKGSQPIGGDYGKWQYLNWACKFTIDANRAELAAG